ncbi:MAG: acyl-CoA dehydrogenase family protein [Acidobacteriota bacterium]
MDSSSAKGGGGFLTSPVPSESIFTREKLNEDQIAFGETSRQFVDTEVMTRIEDIEHKKHITFNGQDIPLGIYLLKKGGEIGFLGIDIPEEYGGLGLDKTTAMYVAEVSYGSPSFAVTFGAHTGIGTQPIVLFGNEEQKKKWLPLLASAGLISCYALTEPGAGSDALSGKTKAVLNPEGTHYILNGSKQFITNGGWADIGVVFAGINGQYSAFIVDLRSPGVSRGAEEKKMGIRGSSTTSLTFVDVLVPKENLLGAPGDAAKIALNILNLGRLKLGFGSLGSCKHAINLAVAYGRERRQFGQPIITFDMQRGKLGEMVARTYALDAMAYRAIGAIDADIAQLGQNHDSSDALAAVLKTHALEASIVKIAASETLHNVAVDAVKIHGGYGYIEEYQVERLMRDNVIEMIYEGTNDINRMVVVDSLVRNIFGAAIGFREYMEQVDSACRKNRLAVRAAEGPLGVEIARVTAAKRAVAYAVQEAIVNCGKDIKNEQQVMQAVADCLIALYAMDSTVSRVHACGYPAIPVAIARLTVDRGSAAISGLTRDLINHVVTGGEHAAKLKKLSALNHAHAASVDVFALRRTITDSVIEAGRYNL